MSIIGIIIGFYGYLFPGNINLMVVELYHTKKYRLLLFMLSLIAIFESIYCWLSLSFLNTIKNNSQLYQTIEFSSFVLILLMGLWMLLEKKQQNKTVHQNTITRGVINIIIHPQQIPFWMGAGVILNRFLPLYMNTGTITLFIVYNAIGCLMVMFTYMFFGNKVLNYFKLNISQINKVMGSLYILLAISQMFNN